MYTQRHKPWHISQHSQMSGWFASNYVSKIFFLKVWRLWWKFDDLNEINLLSSNVSAFSISQSCLPSVNTSEFKGNWSTNTSPKKPDWVERHTVLELALQWCRSWEMESEQNCSLPRSKKLMVHYCLPCS